MPCIRTNIEGIVDEDDSKLAVQMEIQRKISDMNGMFINLDEDEVNNVQDIIDMDDEMDVELDGAADVEPNEATDIEPKDAVSMEPNKAVEIELKDVRDDMNIEPDESVITFIEMDTPFPIPFDSKIDFDALRTDNGENSPQVSNESASVETPSPPLDRNDRMSSSLNVWTTFEGPLDFFRNPSAMNIIDENDISSYLNVMAYHFEGKCVIVSLFHTMDAQCIYSFF